MPKGGSTFVEFSLKDLEKRCRDLGTAVRRIDEAIDHCRNSGTHIIKVKYAKTWERSSDAVSTFEKTFGDTVAQVTGSKVEYDDGPRLDEATKRIRLQAIYLASAAAALSVVACVATYLVMSWQMKVLTEQHNSQMSVAVAAERLAASENHSKELSRMIKEHDAEMAKVRPVATPVSDKLIKTIDETKQEAVAKFRAMAAATRDAKRAEVLRKHRDERIRQNEQEASAGSD